MCQDDAGSTEGKAREQPRKLENADKIVGEGSYVRRPSGYDLFILSLFPNGHPSLLLSKTLGGNLDFVGVDAWVIYVRVPRCLWSGQIQ